MISVFGFEITGPVLLLGAITGITYGLLAVGLVLVFRANRLINFAHGEIGALGAAVFGVVVVNWHVPYWIALPFALALAASIGALAEVAVVRRLRNAPQLMSIVATLGVAQFLLAFKFVVNAQAAAGSIFPQPSGFPEFGVGALRVTRAYFGMLVLTPVLVALLTLFLRKTRFGIAIRGSADNPEAARMSGVSASRMSTLSWAIAGAVSAFTAILILPTHGFIGTETLGPSLLLRALVAAVIARMQSLPVALAAGVGVGIVEQEILWNYPGSGLVEAVLFIAILVTLLVQPRRGGRSEDKRTWTAVLPWPPLDESLRRVWAVRNLGWIVAGTGLVVAVGLSALVTNSASVSLVIILSFSLVGLSLGIVTGLAGMLALGQFAVAGIGGIVSALVVLRTGNYFLGFTCAAVTAAVTSVVIGLPALRIRGLMLAVTTLSFALAAQSWLFGQSWLLSNGMDPGRPIVGSFMFDTGRRYYAFAIPFLFIGLFFARNVWRSGFGRRLRALRDNEDGARAFSVPATRTKLQAFAVSGVLAGLGGAVYAHALPRLTIASFPISSGINLVAMTVLGGVGIIAGPLIGALYIVGLPKFVPLDSAGLAATAFGWLLLIIYFPGGIAQLIRPLRDRLIRALAGGASIEEAETDEPAFARSMGAKEPRADDAPTDDVILQMNGLSKHYGGVVAVDNVTFDVRRGETVGIIGPNGAGKTTVFELIGGFTSADTGTVTFDGTNVSDMGPERRASLGLIRSFQDAALFPTMTVLEVVQLAHERTHPTKLVPALFNLDRTERERESLAREVISLMGLDGYRNKRCNELSTGTRRITEIACMLALEPKVLLLDEPASGVAQRETEALGELLERVKEHLGTTLVVIEHDMPLIMALSDRIIAMESGRVIADGPPKQVQRDPLVIESYLAGDIAAIQRSGRPAPTTLKRKPQAKQPTKKRRPARTG